LTKIEKSCEGVCKNRHDIIGRKTSKGTFHVPCIQYTKRVTNDFENIYMEIIKACGGLP
jgi:hypothetical protein